MWYAGLLFSLRDKFIGLMKLTGAKEVQLFTFHLALIDVVELVLSFHFGRDGLT